LVHALAQLSSLSSLSLVNCTVTSSIAELGAALKQLSSLQELEIDGSASGLGSDAVKTPPSVTAYNPPTPAQEHELRKLAPAVVALRQLLCCIVHISTHGQLRSLRLSLTDMPPVEALSFAANAKVWDGHLPWMQHIAAATSLTRLALGREVLHSAVSEWFPKLAFNLTCLRVSGCWLGGLGWGQQQCQVRLVTTMPCFSQQITLLMNTTTSALLVAFGCSMKA
jgi:hypothetical protein